MEIRQFGVGHRRKVGPPGTEGMLGVVLHSDARATISELAFSKGASIPVHSNPNTTWFIVIEGGGWVGVGDERTRIQAGEAAAWPADVLHAAWTEGTHMRAIVVEFPQPLLALPVVEGEALELEPGGRTPATPGSGKLAQRRVVPPRAPGHDEPA